MRAVFVNVWINSEHVQHAEYQGVHAVREVEVRVLLKFVPE
ncbi:hypothetical protein [Photorhabdus heterorhabditis]|nr:hypothetical protein [Photorhabdus heterorhabditis]